MPNNHENACKPFTNDCMKPRTWNYVSLDAIQQALMYENSKIAAMTMLEMIPSN